MDIDELKEELDALEIVIGNALWELDDRISIIEDKLERILD